jgi:hypothetical protein
MKTKERVPYGLQIRVRQIMLIRGHISINY